MLLRRFFVSFLILANVFGNVPLVEAAATQSSQLGQNLFTYSQDFTQSAVWPVSDVTISANAIQAPNGTQTGTAIVENGAGGVGHAIYPITIPASVKSNQKVTLSVYLKAALRTTAAVQFYGFAANNNYIVNVNLATGGTTSGGTGTMDAFGAQNAGNGWYRVWLTVDTRTLTGGYITFYANVAAAYTGTNGATGIYIWGAQLQKGSHLDPYNRTLASAFNPTYVPSGAMKSNQYGQNLLTYSEEMGNGAQWPQVQVTATQNTTETADPWGTYKAAKIVENTATAFHDINHTVPLSSADIYTFSVFLKNGTRRYIALYQNDLSNQHQATFDLQGGTVTNVGNDATASMIAMGNGWYRCIIVPKVPLGAASPVAYIVPTTGPGAYTGYAGDGSSYFYAVGGQVAKGKSPGAYNRTVASTLNASYVPTGAMQNATVGLRNIQLWLRADQGITLTGGVVSSWADVFSGKRRAITQATAINRPSVVTGQNGRAAVRFDGSNDYLKSAAFTLVQPETVFMVYKVISLGGTVVHDVVFDGNTNGSMTQGSDTTPQTLIFAGTALTVPGNQVVANGTYAYAMFTFNGASSNIRANGASLVSGNAGATNGGGFTLAALGDGTRSTNIEVAEVIVTSAVPSATEINTIETYFKARYGL